VIDFAFDDINDITYPLDELGKAEVADLIINTNWAYLRAKEELNSRSMVSKPKDMPETYFEIIFSGKTPEEIDYKLKIIRKIYEDARAKGCNISLKEVPPDLKAHHMEYPTPRPMMYADHRGGGLDWVGSVMPISKWPEAYRKCMRTMIDHGFSPILDLEVEDNYHYGLFRAIVPFNRSDAEEVEKTKKLIIKLTEIILEEGGVIYKPHDWMAEMMRKKGDPQYFDLLKRIKEFLDPNGIMNPGRWNF
jgi:glycolate oxidase